MDKEIINQTASVDLLLPVEGPIIPPHLNGAAPILEVIEQQAVTPPGGDQYIGGFYQAVSALSRVGQYQILDLLRTVQEVRPMTPEHHTNLLFRAVQAHFMREPGYPYRFSSPLDWAQSLLDLSQNETAFNTVREILLNKDTTTTVYQRYAGERALMTALAGGNSTRAADLGCGGNYGLPGMSLNEPFKPILDDTPGRIVARSLEESLTLEEGLAIDREDPYSADAVRWRHSCGFYPTELEKGELEEVVALEQRLKADQTVRFQQGDLFDLLNDGAVPHRYFDFATLNTILYQLQPHEQVIVIENAKKLLKPNGILFIQDFAIREPDNPTRLHFEGVNWGEKGNYRLFATGADSGDEILEVLKWNNGRCREVTAGADFDRFLGDR